MPNFLYHYRFPKLDFVCSARPFDLAIYCSDGDLNNTMMCIDVMVCPFGFQHDFISDGEIKCPFKGKDPCELQHFFARYLIGVKELGKDEDYYYLS